MSAAASVSWEAARDFLRAAAGEAGEYCGIPMPIEDRKIILHAKHPLRDYLGEQVSEDLDPVKVINSWTRKDGREVVVYEENGERHGAVLGNNPTTYTLDMLGVVPGWDPECEVRAMVKLQGLLKEHIYKQYFMTGAFLETSKRSQVTYIFRRLRPTLALRPNERGEMRIVCALCLHPLGYYSATFAGAMVPTDDVLSHLLLMRADEPYYWRKANQIPPHWPQAGVLY